jgi:3'-phosphoadenosine 5'-phosphosulfate sulfotransferase (PAPS reductase)/FAD synthetase
MRNIVWFSCGAASAVALKLAVDSLSDVVAVYCDTGGEHPDNKRFLKDVERWTGIKITILKNEKYKDHFDVMEKKNYISSRFQAPCSTELKRKMREGYQRPSDVHIFGYTLDETTRAGAFEMRNKGLKTKWILIENQLSHEACLGMIWKAGIEIPVMYKLGFKHNNCIGCPKGRKGYWKKIKKNFPEHFERMKKLERELEYHIDEMYLDEYDWTKVKEETGDEIICDIFCESIYESMLIKQNNKQGGGET